MKRLLLVFPFILVAALSFAQSPNFFNYQAVVRNSSGDLVTNEDVNFKLSILEGTSTGTPVFSETQIATSNDYGLCNLKIGNGTNISGSIETVNWANNNYYLKIELDISGGTSFSEVGTVQLLSVPYALYANSANNLGNVGVYTPGTDTLFVVKDNNGNVVFAVFPDGAKVYVNEGAKGKVGGFAVSGRGTGKGDADNYLVITPDSARIYINDTIGSKGKVGGFAVSGRGTGKGTLNNIFLATADSTRIYVEETNSKGKVGGFAVSGRGTGKDEVNDFFNISGNTSAEIINPSEPRILWYPKKEAFLTGRVLVEHPDSVGSNSFATGYESRAIGEFSQALGYKSLARGDFSMAIGLEAKAIGLNSFAFGESAVASGEGAYAFGSRGLDVFGTGVNGNSINTQASGYASMAIGLGAVSIGEGAIAFGICDTASGDYSRAFGPGSKASGVYSTTVGLYSVASEYHSYAIGRNSIASAQDAISIGGESTASGIYSITLGAQTIASGEYTTAMGMITNAEGGSSTAMGNKTTAIGWGSVAMGYNTIAKPRTLLVIGRNNDTTCVNEGFEWWSGHDPAFIIGNGIDEDHRSNAFTVLQDGYTAIGHASPTEMLDVDGNARFRQVNSDAVGTTNDLRITVDGVLTTSTSDKRLKTNIQPLNGSLGKVLKLKGYTFNWKSENDSKTDAGLIAQEVLDIFPEAVFVNPYDGYYGINYSRFPALFVEAFKEQQQIIEKQKSKMLELENRIKKLEKALNYLLEK